MLHSCSRPEQFVVDEKKDNDYLGMPEDDVSDEYEDEDEDTLKLDSMGNTVEDNEDEDVDSWKVVEKISR